MQVVQLYTKEQCPLCEEAETLLDALQALYDFHIEKIDIYQDDALLEKYQIAIPVIRIGEKELTSNEMEFSTIENYLEQKID